MQSRCWGTSRKASPAGALAVGGGGCGFGSWGRLPLPPLGEPAGHFPSRSSTTRSVGTGTGASPRRLKQPQEELALERFGTVPAEE